MSATPRRMAALLCAVIVMCLPGDRLAHAMDLKRPDVRHFMSHMVKDYGFNRHAVVKLMRSAQSQSSIIDAMNRPAEKARLWYEYRQIFITEKRIRDGVDFWAAHRAELDKASALTGVEPEYIVAILGVETQYGRQTGRYRVLDALATLAFDYPERSAFFLKELEQFLLLTREAKIDAMTATGSYAGAMGAPQFMPSSYRRYAVDATGDGHTDLWNNWLDVFCSVGNYFKEHGWQRGDPVMTEATVDLPRSAAFDGRKFTLNDTVATLRAQGAVFDTVQPPESPAFMIAVDQPDGLQWRVGFKNFYVITRYNRSALYGMAATELAAALKHHLNTEQLPVRNAISGANVVELMPP